MDVLGRSRRFLSSTPYGMVFEAYLSLGYVLYPAEVLARLSCFRDALAQGGANESHALERLLPREAHSALTQIATSLGCRLTRYADDIVFSGTGMMPELLPSLVSGVFETGPWRLASHKELVQPLKGRMEIYGVLVKPNQLRLTKGYRNQIRAYSHVLATKGPQAKDYQGSSATCNMQNTFRGRRTFHRVSVLTLRIGSRDNSKRAPRPCPKNGLPHKSNPRQQRRELLVRWGSSNVG